MLTRMQRRRIARRIVAATLAVGTGAGIAVMDATAASSGAPICLDSGPVTYRPSPDAKPITVPACPRKAPPPAAACTTAAGGSDGRVYDMESGKVIPACAKPAAPKRQPSKLRVDEPKAKRWCEIRKTCAPGTAKTSTGAGGVPATAGERARQAAAATAAKEQQRAQQAREREQQMARR
jgi:hypothetical protein